MDRETKTADQATGTPDLLAAFKPLAPAAWMATAWFDNVAELGSEVTSFVAERIRQDVETQHALMQCKSLEEVQSVQAEFVQRAFDQYNAETGKLIEMSGEMVVKMQPDPEKQA